jgi:hypothetical protein
MAYLIKSVLTMLGARGQIQGPPRENFFLQVNNHQLAALPNVVRIKTAVTKKKATFAAAPREWLFD